MNQRNYKDTVFRKLFGSEEYKENALALYNAMNGTSYGNPDDLEITTIEDTLYLGMKNDVSFLIGDEMNLWEEQSTFNPNMPFRGLGYFARLYSKYAEKNRLSLYGTKRFHLPTPKYYVFYIGDESLPERTELKLSDSFDRNDFDLEVRTTVININPGMNPKLLSECKVLSDYTFLIQEIREHRKNMDLEKAIDKAVNECISQNRLSSFLRTHRAEVKMDFLTEYNEEEVREQLREEAFEDGVAKGREEGREEEILSLVRDGFIPLSLAAERLGKREEEIQKTLLELK